MDRLSLTSPVALAACVCALTAIPTPPAAAAAACPNANLTPAPTNVEQVRTAVLCLIDQERERHGEGALAVNTKLTRAAQRHSREMAESDYFAHNSPNGQTPLSRMRASGYIAPAQDGYVVGENIAWGTLWLATPQSIVRAWMESPGHRANILDGAYRETGVGVEPRAPATLAEGQQGALYTQDFGAIVPPGHSSRRTPAGAVTHRTPAGAGTRRTRAGAGELRHAAGAGRPPVGAGRITSGTRKHGKRSKRHHGSTRRQSRHRHRLGARHRTRHRRAAGRARRQRADQRSRRRHRKANR